MNPGSSRRPRLQMNPGFAAQMGRGGGMQDSVDLGGEGLRPVTSAISTAKTNGNLILDGICLGHDLPQEVYGAEEFTPPGGNWYSCENIRRLSARDCSLQYIDDTQLSRLECLEILDLTGNKLEYLFSPNVSAEDDNQISKQQLRLRLPALKKLIVRRNKLKAINKGLIEGLPRLTELALDENQMLDIDVRLFYQLLTELELSIFTASSCRLTFREYNIGRNVAPNPFLRVLNLSGNKIASLDVTGFPALEELNLSNNTLASIPIGLAGCHRLMSLNLSHNRLTYSDGLNAELSGLVALRELDLSYNALTYLPSSPFLLPALGSYVVSDNNISGMDGQMIWKASQLAGSSSRKTQKNSISTRGRPDNNDFQTGKNERFALTILDLSRNALDRIAPELGTLPALQRLYVAEGNPLRGMHKLTTETSMAKIAEYLISKLPADHPYFTNDTEELAAIEARKLAACVGGSNNVYNRPITRGNDNSTRRVEFEADINDNEFMGGIIKPERGESAYPPTVQTALNFDYQGATSRTAIPCFDLLLELEAAGVDAGAEGVFSAVRSISFTNCASNCFRQGDLECLFSHLDWFQGLRRLVFIGIDSPFLQQCRIASLLLDSVSLKNRSGVGLSSLEEIRFQGCKRLRRIEIAGLMPTLREIYIKDTPLETLQINGVTTDYQSTKLDNLASLTITECRLNALPENLIDAAPNLREAILAGNAIRVIPQSIINLRKLVLLDISRNDIAELPSELGFLVPPESHTSTYKNREWTRKYAGTLTKVALSGNFIRRPSQIIQQRGWDEIAQWLRDQVYGEQIEIAFRRMHNTDKGTYNKNEATNQVLADVEIRQGKNNQTSLLSDNNRYSSYNCCSRELPNHNATANFEYKQPPKPVTSEYNYRNNAEFNDYNYRSSDVRSGGYRAADNNKFSTNRSNQSTTSPYDTERDREYYIGAQQRQLKEDPFDKNWRRNVQINNSIKSNSDDRYNSSRENMPPSRKESTNSGRRHYLDSTPLW